MSRQHLVAERHQADGRGDDRLGREGQGSHRRDAAAAQGEPVGHRRHRCVPDERPGDAVCGERPHGGGDLEQSGRDPDAAEPEPRGDAEHDGPAAPAPVATSATTSVAPRRTWSTSTDSTAVTATEAATADSTRKRGSVRRAATDARKPSPSRARPAAYGHPARTRANNGVPAGRAPARRTPTAWSTVAAP